MSANFGEQGFTQNKGTRRPLQATAEDDDVQS